SSTSSTSSSYSLSFFFSRYGDPRHLHSFPTRRSSDLKNLAQVRFLSRAFFPICDEHGGISHLHSNGKNRCRMPFRRMADGRGMDEHRFVRALLYWMEIALVFGKHQEGDFRMKNAFAYRMYLSYCAVVALSMALMSTAAGVYYIRTVEMDAFQLLMTGFALELSVFLFEIPTGVVADLYSRKRSMAIGLLMVGCGFLLQGVVPLFVAVLAAQVLWGVGYTFLSGADQAWIADELKTKRLEGVFLR